MDKPRVLLIEDDFELSELLSVALEKEGFIAVVAHSAEEAIGRLKDGRPDLAIVDLVLPDGLGSDLLDVFKALVPPVPSIAISGVFRGDRYDRNITRRHKAKCFFQKPFSTTDLVSEVSSILSSGALSSESDDEEERLEIEIAWEEASETTTEDAEEKDLTDELIEGEPIASSSPTASSKIDRKNTIIDPSLHGASLENDIFRKEKHSSKGPPNQQPHQGVGMVEDLVAGEHDVKIGELPPEDAASQSPEPSHDVVDPGMPSLAHPVPLKKKPSEAVAPPSEGELSDRSVPVLLVSLGQAESDGALELLHEKASKTIYLRKGQPIFASSNLSGDRLLEFAVKSGAVRKEDADSAQLLAKEEGRRIGEVLIEFDILDRSRLRNLVRDQVRSIIWSTFSWRNGRYSICSKPGRPRVPTALTMPLHMLILDGTKVAVPLVLLREEVPNDLVLAPRTGLSPSAKGLDIDPNALGLLELADGTKAVEDFLALSDDDERSVRASLKAFLDLGLLTTRDKIGPRRGRIGFVV